jgi:tetratricopeptide (TPR) repeat protein
VKTELPRPVEDAQRLTREIKVTIETSGANGAHGIAATQVLPVSIEWPTFAMMAANEAASKGSPEEVVAAQALKIDAAESEEDFREIRNVLEVVVKNHPKTDAAYIELARVAMKMKWGPEGLSEAEGLLDSARGIRQDNPNMKILFAYVYAHQRRFKEAAALFEDVAKSPTPNLWLWANWGELLEMQDKPEAAIQKYKQAVAQPPKDDTYDRARRQAYARLIALNLQLHDLGSAEALYKQRIADYGNANCHGAGYANFLLYQKSDVDGALAVSQKLQPGQCAGSDANEISGAVNYVKWAAAQEPERSEFLRQARVQFPAGPRLFYKFASNEKMFEVARKLSAAGDKVDQVDNMNFTALAYALQERDAAAVRRLVRLGASPDALVGAQKVPVALIPVVNRDFGGIKLLMSLGVDYSKIRYNGATAFDHARQTQDRELLDALEPKGKAMKTA